MALPKLGLELIVKGVRGVQRASTQFTKAVDGMSRSVFKARSDVARSFEDMTKSSKAFASMSARDLDAARRAFNSLLKTFGPVNIEAFDEAYQKSVDVADAFKVAAVGASSLSVAIPVVTTALAALSSVASASAAVVKQSVDDYMEAAQQLRLLQMEMGGTTEAVSGFALAAQKAGTDVTTLFMTMGMFEKKMTDLELRIAAGSEESHEFERAMGALGVSIREADGTLRESRDVLYDVADQMERLGPGTLTTGIAMNLFGRTGRAILPFLLEGAEGLKAMEARARELGATMTSRDVAASEAFRRALVDLNWAMDGVMNTIARDVLPILTAFVNDIVKAVNAFRQFTILARSASSALIAFAAAIVTTRNPVIAVTKAYDAFLDRLQKVSGVLTAQEKADAAAAAERERRAQTIVVANQQIMMIEQEMYNLQKSLIEKRLDLERRFTQQWEDILIQRARAIEDAERQLAQRLEDIARAYGRRTADILERYRRRQAEKAEGFAKRMAEFDEQAHDRREDLLKKHQQRMEDIRRRFHDTAEEAARARDAIAFLRAMRDRDRALRDEKINYGRRLEDLEAQLAKQKKKLKDAYKDERDMAAKRLKEQLEDAEKARKRQLEDLEIALRREEEERQISYRRQDEDFARAKERQEEEARRHYLKEEESLKTALTNQLEILENAGEAQHGYMESLYDDLIKLREDYYKELLEIDRRARSSMGAGSPLGRTYLPNIYRRAEGGVDVVSKPTHYLAGESGREIAAFIPLKGNVHHTFGPLSGNINMPGASPQSEAQIVNIITQFFHAWARRTVP